MLKKRNLLILVAFLLSFAVIGLEVYFYVSKPPMAAMLLPEGQTLIYVNLKPLHLFDLSKSAPIEPDAEYKQFVAQTGVQFERDLDAVAMSRRDTPDRSDVESSEIFVGRFDQERMKNYLSTLSSASEQYRNRTIYEILHEGHDVRVSILDATHVAVTNMGSREPMHGIIDRYLTRHAAGPSLLDAFYDKVPTASVAWLIARIPNQPDNVQLPGGFGLTLPPDTVAVTSLRYTGSLLLRADILAQSQAQAKQIVDSANTHLAVVRSIGQMIKTKGPDQDIKAAFDSIQVEQKENVAVITATIPQSLLKKIWSEAQAEGAVPAPPARR
jgi:hypothetical protein